MQVRADQANRLSSTQKSENEVASASSAIEGKKRKASRKGLQFSLLLIGRGKSETPQGVNSERFASQLHWAPVLTLVIREAVQWCLSLLL